MTIQQQQQQQQQHLHPHGQRAHQRIHSAHTLRLQAAEINDDIADLNHWICERADRCGWQDSMVVSGLRAVDHLEHERDQKIMQAREIGTTFYNS